MQILVVFLCLAALYESWSIPFSVILAVPVGIFGALLATWLLDQANDVYFKVGMLTTMGVAAKNAILIVEFARDLHAQGKSAADAVLEAARLRLAADHHDVARLHARRPASGDCLRSRFRLAERLGISVLGGMISATVLGIFFVPSFFVIITKLFEAKLALVVEKS